MRKSKLFVGAALVVALVALGVGQSKMQEPSIAQSGGVMAPHFLVDPYWPKPLPNNWAMGNTATPRSACKAASQSAAHPHRQSLNSTPKAT